MKNKLAFTLAEVLITLGIIGVVAALTLPALIQNYQKQVYVNALKKSVSTLENGFKMALAEDGVDELQHTELFGSLTTTNNNYVYNTTNEIFENNLKKYFHIINIKSYENSFKPYKTLNNNDYYELKKEIFLSDGSSIILFGPAPFSGYFSKYDQNVLIDVNTSAKNPNQWGRDLFGFKFDTRGNINGGVWAYTSEACNKNNTGFSCGDYLLKNNYNMDY